MTEAAFDSALSGWAIVDSSIMRPGNSVSAEIRTAHGAERDARQAHKATLFRRMLRHLAQSSALATRGASAEN